MLVENAALKGRDRIASAALQKSAINGSRQA
jgi:hypothetical protein